MRGSPSGHSKPDISKQAIEIIFSHKYKKSDPPPLSFNGIPVKRDVETKHLGMMLDSKLNFESHIQGKKWKDIEGSPRAWRHETTKKMGIPERPS